MKDIGWDRPDDLGMSNIVGIVLLLGVVVLLAAIVLGITLQLGSNATQSNGLSESIRLQQTGDGAYAVRLVSEPTADSIRVSVQGSSQNVTLTNVGDVAYVTLPEGETLTVIATTDGSSQLLLSHTQREPGATTISVATSASPSPLTFSVGYGVNGDGGAPYSFVRAADGGYVLYGYRAYSVPYNYHAVKMDAQGDEVWNQTPYGGYADSGNYGHDIIQTGSGDYVFVGQDDLGTDSDVYIVRLNSTGSIEDQDTLYSATDEDVGYDIIQTNDGGLAIAGYTQSYGGSDNDVWLVKLYANGTEQWNRTYGGSANDKGKALIQTASGGFVIGGQTKSYGRGGLDHWLIKVNATGAEVWNHTYGRTQRKVQTMDDIIRTADGGYATIGTSSETYKGSNAFMVKTNVTGVQEWNKTYGPAAPSGDELGKGLVQANGGYTIIGYTTTYDSGGGDMWLAHTGSSGTEQWNRSYDYAGGEDMGVDIAKTSDGYVLGAYRSTASGEEYWLVKTNESGGVP